MICREEQRRKYNDESIEDSFLEGIERPGLEWP
jgi:hypothetical protein